MAFVLKYVAFRRVPPVAAGFAAALLAGCSSLPTSGPTGHQLLSEASKPVGDLPFRVIEVKAPVDLPAVPQLPAIVASARPGPTDLIGTSDIIAVDVYEAGVTLFAPSARTGTADGTGVSGAEVQHMGALRVDDAGYIHLPYVGRLRAAGETTGELAEQIRRALHGLSQNPQVQVGFIEHVSASVLVGGEVVKPGRLVLTTNRETLSDAVALAGGYHGEAKDLVARITRGDQTYEYRLADVLTGPARDMAMLAGDRVELVRAPQSFSVMGAPGKVELMPFTTSSENLAEAVAKAGGANPYLGDARAIFVFRYEQGEDGVAHPVVYHLNMMNADAYFLSQHFAMRDKDVLYVGNAASNQPGKFINLLSQLFSPIVAVQSGLVSSGVIK